MKNTLFNALIIFLACFYFLNYTFAVPANYEVVVANPLTLECNTVSGGDERDQSLVPSGWYRVGNCYLSFISSVNENNYGYGRELCCETWKICISSDRKYIQDDVCSDEPSDIPSKSKLWADFKSRYGDNWNVLWNKNTGTPSMIYGSQYRISGSISDKYAAENTAMQIITDNIALFGIDSVSDLQLDNVEHGNVKWYVRYDQYYGDVLVYGGRLSITISDDGMLKSLGSDIYTGIALSTIPDISENIAVDIAKDEFSYNNNPDSVSLVIFPTTVNGTLQYNLAWDIVLTSDRPLSSDTIFVDAHDGEILYNCSNFISAGGIPGKESSNAVSNESGDAVNYGLVLALLVILIILFSYNMSRNKKKIKGN